MSVMVSSMNLVRVWLAGHRTARGARAVPHVGGNDDVDGYNDQNRLVCLLRPFAFLDTQTSMPPVVRHNL